MNKKFYIKTFGCQMNKNDSLIMSQILKDHGFEPVANEESADVFIVNTCTVRAHAENRALAYISGLRNWRQAGKRVLAVVGCLAVDKAGTITKRLHSVDLILGPDSYRKIADYVSEIMETDTRIIDTKLGDETYYGVYSSAPQVSSYVSIMRGCDNYCSYCIVPYVRGRARSRNPTDIFKEVAHLIKSGVKDVTLLGQNVNEYHYERYDFAELLARTSEVHGLFRLRFLTSHPKDFRKNTVQVIKTYDNICEWFHLPLQSGNNRILKLMNRKYSKEEYRHLIAFIRQEIPHATITTDAIVGFPTETEEEFQDTISLLEEIRFDNTYMYRYSVRPGTKASKLKSLSEDTIKNRLTRLITTQHKIVREKTADMIGKTYEVLFESEAKNNASRGKTRGNKDVVVDTQIAPGEVRRVKITCVKGHTPVGTIVH
jgi:tRNA-2-methylthio-N6-dimethylallyladenosine synthase